MIPHNRPTLASEEAAAALRVLGSGWLAAGPEVEAFEQEFCDYLGLPRGHAVALSSGTAALYMALWALGASGKRVAFPVYACSALRNAVALAAGREVLVGVSEQGPWLDPLAGEAEILVAPHMYGLPIPLGRTVYPEVIEDCAQALGAKVDGRFVGLQGRIGIFSFYATKIMTSGGQGGMLVSRERAIVERVRDYREFDCRDDHAPRFNFQMTDLQAAIGREQLRKLPLFLARREALFQRYARAGLSLLDRASAEGTEPVRFRAVLKTPHAEALRQRLEAAGVKALVPLEDWELLGDPASFPRALQWTRQTLSLPLYPTLSNDEQDHIIQALA